MAQVSTAQPAPWLRFLFKQFGCPSGWLGSIAGRFMARNAYDDAWVVDLLDVQATDRLIEVGFGPGVAIELLARRATQGLVAGVDPSEVMLHQALKRVSKAASTGRVDLRIGGAEKLPFADGSFDKACALHSIYFWPSVEQGARELQRVLVPGGRVAIAMRMQQERGGAFNPSRYGMTEQRLTEISHIFAANGFTEITTEQRDFPRELVSVLLARRR
ncbi:MAG TPA: class I SAM-dependent methyltransferase [Chloroflexota bacterium]|jgi:ubiquinone/menaquinone biosynthesis C-methylase UbiE